MLLRLLMSLESVWWKYMQCFPILHPFPFSDLTLVNWNQPWWEDFYHGNCWLYRQEYDGENVNNADSIETHVVFITVTLWWVQKVEDILFQHSNTTTWFSKEVSISLMNRWSSDICLCCFSFVLLLNISENINQHS